MDVVIKEMYRYPHNGGVFKMIWEATKSDAGFSAKVFGQNHFTPNPDAADFVPFEDITESDAKGWLLNDQDWVRDTEEELDGIIERQKNPPVLNGLPWKEEI